ncbi:hypothetical protein ACU8KH_04938 [Lachancea thermotolerans]
MRPLVTPSHYRSTRPNGQELFLRFPRKPLTNKSLENRDLPLARNLSQAS